MEIRINKKSVNKFKQGYPLVQLEDLMQPSPILPKEWVDFVAPNGQFLGKGYVGQQNKGIGWLVTQQQLPLDHAFFVQLFAAAAAGRQQFFNSEDTTAFRLFNGEGDGLGGVTVDYYNGFGVVSWYNETLTSQKALLINALTTACPTLTGLYEKHRFDSSNAPETQHIWGEQAPEPLIIKENGVQYATYMNEGLMTGIFLDQKDVRGQLVSGLTVGEHVLNMFSYTGAFSVAAAMGGAYATTSVDLAKRSFLKTREQFEVNGLDVAAHQIVVMDVFEYFRYAQRKGLVYDTIILDPPSFARNKKKVFSVAKNYGDLVENSIDIMSQQGRLIASTNAANVSLEKFQGMIESALQAKQVTYKKSQLFRLPEDFKVLSSFQEGNYLKVFIYDIQK